MAKRNDNLTADRVRFLFSYNPETGVLLWRNPTSLRVAIGDPVGTMASNGRRYVAVDSVKHLAHRIAWLYVHGKLPEENLAARNGNYDDLRLSNLMPQSFVDTANKNSLRNTNTSGFRGVIWDKNKGKWRAEITRDYLRVQIGRFDTKEEAHEAYVIAQRQTPVKPKDPEQRRQHVAYKLHQSRVRRLWQRALRDNDGVSGWESFATFTASIGADVQPHAKLAKKHNRSSIGPTNYKWVPNTEHDYGSREGRSRYQQEYRGTYPDKAKDSDLRKAFGITLADYNRMLEAQGHVCAICKQPEVEIRKGKLQSLGVDHCHSTGAVRGLLCIACNGGIARFKDRTDLLQSAIAYLQKHTKKA